MRAAGVALLALAALLALPACESEGDVARWTGAPVTLPLEVMGADGTERAITLVVPRARAPEVRTLHLRTHGVRYAGQASVRVNDGAWVPIARETMTVADAERALGGLGGPSALRFTLPLPAGAARAGLNTIAFRFDRTDGISSGFRVLDVNFVTVDGDRVVGREAFRQDDPALWRAPRPAAADIDEGRRLWREAALRAPFPTGATPLRATCGDCHADDGRDLKFFGYSNVAIVARAEFHGLSREAGEQIASYVRTLPVPTRGRPWDPPYQPGPGLDVAPLEAWAAGAGLDAVAARDRDTLASLSPAGADGAFATTGRSNLRELPVALPLPDWNRWLPRVHPLDAWDAFGAGTPLARYVALRDRLRRDGRAYVTSGFDGDFYAVGAAAHDFVGQHGPPVVRVAPDEARATVLWRWLAVKSWALAHERALEGFGPELYGPQSEPRTWLARWGVLWGAAPSRPSTAAPKDAARAIWYERAAWYHLSAVTNPGNRRRLEHSPMDWAGAYESVRELSERGVPQLGRLFAYAVKSMQEADNGVGPRDAARGWTLYLADPSLLVDESLDEEWSDVAPAARRALLERYLAAWLAKARSHAPGEYQRSSTFVGKTWAADPADHVPAPARFGGVSDRLLWALPRLRAAGVAPELLDGVAAFGKGLWPLGAWSP